MEVKGSLFTASDPQTLWVKPRSYDISFHEFRPRFALFPIVGAGRTEMARGLVSTPVASRIMAVNSSHIKGCGSDQTASVHPFTRPLPRDLPSSAPFDGMIGRNYTEHSQQVRTSRF
ncbi:hypothetical protein AVEN_87171-1 [Araneus ventricosus]|uniref:Uncharacterized protein n=1 Tax=Araneus ventricosus TaxID=182803 RepID=A0A4Y2TFP8_ARAVE|nr:hypothetical protein AVEN_87171-1 [Araneus ventricosus]